MSAEIIRQKLLNYHSQTIVEEENALKEIAQEVALMALSRADFFNIAAFQGGTCLRILYGLERFSEDLDFVLQQPDKLFSWSKYIVSMQQEFYTYGYDLTVRSKDKLDKNVRTAFLKTDSIGGMLSVKDRQENRTKFEIKLEIDVNPPAGSDFELKYLDFPLPYAVLAQDLPSLFASKCHALLCRTYVKGRDWYDFLWYVSRQVPINFLLLSNAINQAGPWKNQEIKITPFWFKEELKRKINAIDWQAAKIDVRPFLREREAASLTVWNKDFFLSRIDKLNI